MSFIGQNLKDWSRQLDRYVSDQRPANVEELRNLQDIIRQTVYASEQLLQRLKDKNIPTYLVQNLKSAIG